MWIHCALFPTPPHDRQSVLTSVPLRCAKVLVRTTALAKHRVEEDVEAALLVSLRCELEQDAGVPEPSRLCAAQWRRKVGRLLLDKRVDVVEIRLLHPKALPSAIVAER